MANTKSNTTGSSGTSGTKTTKNSSSEPAKTATVKTATVKSATVQAAPEEPDYDASGDDTGEFDEYDAAAALEAKAEAAAQEAEAAAQDAESAAQEAEAAAQDAEVAAAAAMAARAALTKRSTTGSSQSEPRPRRRRRKQNAASFGDNDGYLNMMSGLLGNMSSGDWDEDAFDDMSQGVAMVLGSGPAFATLGTMLANSTAQSTVLMNATQMQRQLDMVGLSCTSACVQQLLNMNNGSQDQD